jgi:ATP-dependent DNA helicase RecQ
LNISGVGKVKNERYGAIFLSAIREYCTLHRIEEKYKTPPREKYDAGRRYMAVGDAYNAGESVESLMKRYGVSADTILNHLARFITAGNPLRSSEDLIALSNLEPDKQMEVFKVFDKLGPDMLKPVYDALNGTVNYDELRILRLCFLCENR